MNLNLQIRKERKGEHGAFSGGALNRDQAALSFDNSLCQRQPQSDPRRIQRAFAAVEPLEDVMEVFRPNSRTIIGYKEAEHGLRAFPGNVNLPLWTGVIQSVFYDIGDGFTGPFQIAEDGLGRSGEGEPFTVLLSAKPKLFN